MAVKVAQYTSITFVATIFQPAMKKSLLALGLVAATFAATAQRAQNVPQAPSSVGNTTVVVPQSPILKYQVLFIGGHDSVATVNAQGQPDGKALAKQWHDFIGFTKDNTAGSQDLGWVTVNHEMIQANPKIGDGGGMTSFKVRKSGDSLVVVNQTLPDGRTGKFFNVDFNPTGATGMNCGGIQAPDGRIWTAEEWFQTSNAGIFAGGNGFTDTSDFTIGTTSPAGFPGFNGSTLKRFQNLNYMTEIDPKTARAIRKQYNWGRGGFEGGVIMSDNKTVYLGIDESPAPWIKFVANTAGDFTTGNLFAWKADGSWVQIPNNNIDSLNRMSILAFARGAAMFNRVEWVAENNGKVYFTETGRDNLGTSFRTVANAGATVDSHWVKAVRIRHPELAAQNNDSIVRFFLAGNFRDYYGRVMVFDPATSKMDIFLEGGPFLTVGEPAAYPDKHLSNPDGLGFMKMAGKTYMVIEEDLNGTSFGRMPAGAPGINTEAFLYDMDEPNPTVNKLKRIAITPLGAEITGMCYVEDADAILINSQHPSTSNPFPYNNSLTFALSGWSNVVASLFEQPKFEGNGFQIWPNPASRELHFNEETDVTIRDLNGRLVKEAKNTNIVDIYGIPAGTYFVTNRAGLTQKLIIQ
jgi:secreted PhoX family phosphatase